MKSDLGRWKTRLTPELIDRYTSSGQWKNRTLADSALRWVRENPRAVAIVERERTATFAEIVEDARSLLTTLQRYGLQPGDVISFQVPNWIETAAINLAASMGGFVCNPIVFIYRDAEVGYILRNARTKVLFIPERYRNFDYVEMANRLRGGLPLLDKIVVVRGQGEGCVSYAECLEQGRSGAPAVGDVDPNSIKMLLYTSGTTGSPKGVLHTHNTLMAEELAIAGYWKLTRNDVVFMPSPVSHVAGYTFGLEMAFVAGIKLVLMDRWDAAEAIKLIQEHGATFTVGATPFLSELVAELERTRIDLPSFRLFASGGAPVPPEIVYRAARVLRNGVVCRVFGSSEAPTVTLGILRREDQELGATTDGRIVNHEVRICDPVSGAVLPEGVEGEIVTRGPEVMVGYADWSQTEEAFDADGYFHMGDLGYISHGDFITVSGRRGLAQAGGNRGAANTR